MVIFPGKFLIAELQFPHIANKSTCVTELLWRLNQLIYEKILRIPSTSKDPINLTYDYNTKPVYETWIRKEI